MFIEESICDDSATPFGVVSCLNTFVATKINKHDRRAYTYFKYGLNYIAKLLNNNDIYEFITCFKFCHVFSKSV